MKNENVLIENTTLESNSGFNSVMAEINAGQSISITPSTKSVFNEADGERDLDDLIHQPGYGVNPDADKNAPFKPTYKEGEEQDVDELVHNPLADDEGGSLTDPEETSLNEDDEFEPDDLRNK